MKLVLVLAALSLAAIPTTGHTQDTSCTVTAQQKKLAGAALNSFMRKCREDTTERCEAQATDKKLSGAAKTSFTQKCMRDGLGI